MKTIVLTGGTGFVGSHILAQLLAAGYAVRANVRSERKAAELVQNITELVGADKIVNLHFFKADFGSAENWVENMTGCEALIHVASPLGTGRESREEMIDIARNGTLLVLDMAKQAAIKRVVMTSSQAASTPPTSVGAVVLDESYWSDETNPELDPYRISKIEAEKAAWEFASENGINLTTVLPGAIFGPVLSKSSSSSTDIIARIMRGMPGCFKLNFEVCDVRDIAALHILAMENDVAQGKRYLAASQLISMTDTAKLLKAHFPQFTKINTRELPNSLVRFLALFVPALRSFVPMFKRQYRHTTHLAESELGWTQHTPNETILSTAESLIKLNNI